MTRCVRFVLFPITFILLPPCLTAADFSPLPNFLQPPQSLRIVHGAQPTHPWTVSGEFGATLGRQNGRFEAWAWPNKILSGFTIHGTLADYPVPIDVNAFAAEIDVTPAETVITYSHPAFTVRQHQFAARGPTRAVLPAAVVFEIHSSRPLELTFSFTPEMLRMWPSPNFGRPNGEWIKSGDSGFYLLHTDKQDFTGIVAMPRTHPGIMVPYQEHPQTFPLQLVLQFDPKQDDGLLFPLVFGMANASKPDEQIAAMLQAVPELYRNTRRYYDDFLIRHLAAKTPDARVDEALAWAEVSLDQSQVRYGAETGMVAGYYESADSARPGYGWFFGRDTLWSTYAINSYGDAGLTHRALDFLIKRQREDGKIMHEFSQSAHDIDWKSTPYFYAAADSAPLFIMAMRDYVHTSGDISYLRTNWNAVKKASAFSRAHTSPDGITDNTQGTGWVESWPPGMPYQESYLAALDCQAQHALADLAKLMDDNATAEAAEATSRSIGAKLSSAFFDSKSNMYAFSRNRDGSLDDTPSIYPAVAWWDGTLELPKAESMLSRWASAEFFTDWGTRDISNRSKYYDPISYHQGSVWPLFTGWVALAQYRAGRPLAGYATLMSNAQLTWASDLGSVTELLSGDYYDPLGRSSSHQTWSSAMVASPMVRGLFGLDWDVPDNVLRVNPHLPASWPRAALRRVPFGSSSVDLTYERSGEQLIVTAQSTAPICLQSGPQKPCNKNGGAEKTLRIPLPAVELEMSASLPHPGARTSQMKVLREEYGRNQAIFRFSAMGSSTHDMPVRLNRPGVRVEGGEIKSGTLHIQMPGGEGYVETTVAFRW